MSNQPTKYSLVPDPYDADSPYWCVRLEDGEFAGVVVHLSDMRMADFPDGRGNINARFNHDIVFIPEELRKKEFPEEKRQEFVNILGGIMVNMVQENLDMKSGLPEEDGDKLVIKRSIKTDGDPFVKGDTR